MSGVKWSKIEPHNKDVVIVVGSGKSLTNFNFRELKAIPNSIIITVNGSGESIPDADYWFTLDPWGLHGPQLPSKFTGKLYAAVPEDFGTKFARAQTHQMPANSKISYLHRVPFHTVPTPTPSDVLTWGLNEDPRCINTGNSGFGALNLAYHMRPKYILLLGIDAGTGYFYTTKKSNKNLSHLPNLFKSAVGQLKDKQITVLNASPNSLVTAFPRYTIPAALGTLSKLIK